MIAVKLLLMHGNTRVIIPDYSKQWSSNWTNISLRNSPSLITFKLHSPLLTAQQIVEMSLKMMAETEFHLFYSAHWHFIVTKLCYGRCVGLGRFAVYLRGGGRQTFCFPTLYTAEADFGNELGVGSWPRKVVWTHLRRPLFRYWLLVDILLFPPGMPCIMSTG